MNLCPCVPLLSALGASRVCASLGLSMQDMWASGVFPMPLSSPLPPAMSLGPTLPVASVASFKDLLMGIDLEPFNALQQNKEEGERELFPVR